MIFGKFSAFSEIVQKWYLLEFCPKCDSARIWTHAKVEISPATPLFFSILKLSTSCTLAYQHNAENPNSPLRRNNCAEAFLKYSSLHLRALSLICLKTVILVSKTQDLQQKLMFSSRKWARSNQPKPIWRQSRTCEKVYKGYTSQLITWKGSEVEK